MNKIIKFLTARSRKLRITQNILSRYENAPVYDKYSGQPYLAILSTETTSKYNQQTGKLETRWCVARVILGTRKTSYGGVWPDYIIDRHGYRIK